MPTDDPLRHPDHAATDALLDPEPGASIPTDATVDVDHGASDAAALARAYVAAWNDRDDAIAAHVTDSFVMYDPAAPEAGVAGPKGEVHGPDGLRQFVAFIDTAFPDFHVEVRDLVATDDLAMYEVALTMTHDGPLGPIPPTGRRVEVLGASVLRFQDGLVDEHRFHTNMADTADQLGLGFPAVLRLLPRMVIQRLRGSQ
jgi:predicted ester cyclase